MNPVNNDSAVKIIIFTEHPCSNELTECPAIRKAMATAAVNNCSINLVSWDCSSEPIISNLYLSPHGCSNCAVLNQIKLYRHETICVEITHEKEPDSKAATSEVANPSEQSHT